MCYVMLITLPFIKEHAHAELTFLRALCLAS